ncbi:hypothetical protein Tco_1253286, partial [Tanacetum coccineum]
SSPQNTQTPGQALQEDTQLPQTSVPIPNVADEAVFKEWDDRVVRATTTAASLDAAQASGVNTPGSDEERIEHQELTDNIPPTPYDSPLSGGYTPRSDEGRPDLHELMAICTNLSNRVLALEQSKTAQDLVINKLQKKVKRLEKALRARTPGMKLFKIGTSRRKGLDKENVSKQGKKSDKTKPMFKDSNFDVLDDAMENIEDGSTAEQITTTGDTLNTASVNVSTAGPSISTIKDIFEDEMTTIADTLVAIRSAIPRTTSVMIRNVEEEPKRATPVRTVKSQDKEEQAQFEREQRIAIERAVEQEAKDATLIEQMEHVQARMDVDELLASRLQEQEREQFSVDEHARFLKLYKKEQQWIDDFVPMSDDSGKKDDSIEWEAKRLFDSCGVHVLLMDNGIAIHMMIEKKYPLTQEMLSRMLNRRLEVDHESEMAFELLRFTRSQLKK